jgi:hypothetical protein
MDTFFRVMATLGGTGVILFALCKFLGDVWKNRIKAQDEALAAQRGIQPESYLRTQFDVYIELWKTLQAFHLVVDALWEKATEENIKALVGQLEGINQTVNQWSVLICEEHLLKLRALFDTLGLFRIGKSRLYQLRAGSDWDDGQVVDDIQWQIDQNRELRDRFKSLMEDIRLSFSKRLSGQDDYDGREQFRLTGRVRGPLFGRE